MKINKCKKPLSLVNDGKLEIVFIGTGTAFGVTLFNNNFLLIKGKTHILVDFGMTGPVALHKSTGLTVPDIRNLFITHSHTDHIGGLEFYALTHRYLVSNDQSKQKPNMVITDEYKKILWEMSLSGGMEWNERDSKDKRLCFEDYFIPIAPDFVTNGERQIFHINFGGIDMEIFRTNHYPDSAKTSGDAFISYGLFLDKKIFISCDTKFDKELIDRYKDKSEVMFHDCSFEFNPVHASLKELKTLSNDVKSKMLLMHYGDDYKTRDISGFAGFVKQGYSYIID